MVRAGGCHVFDVASGLLDRCAAGWWFAVSLRDECIQAAAETINRWLDEDDEWAVHADEADCATAAFDAVLGVLSEHADEWNQQVGQFTYEDEWAQQLLAVLEGDQ